MREFVFDLVERLLQKEEVEQTIVDSATAAQTLAELEAEIAILKDLEARALRLKLSGEDAKWRELESVLDEHFWLRAQNLPLKKKLRRSPRDRSHPPFVGSQRRMHSENGSTKITTSHQGSGCASPKRIRE